MPMAESRVASDKLALAACARRIAVFDSAGEDDTLDGYSCADFQQPGPDKIYSFTAPKNEEVTVSLTSFAPSDLDVFVLSNGLGCLASNCIGHAETVGPEDEQIIFSATAGETYYVVVEDFLSSFAAFTLDVQCGDPNAIFLDSFESGDTSRWSKTVP